MNLKQLQEKLPAVLAWIDRTLAAHAGVARPVAAAGFARLGSCFPVDVLNSARIIPVARVPVPPLAESGLAGFDEFEKMEAAGITYRSAFFVRRECAGDESLCFHELVHVVQWQHLGPEKFLMAYALGFLLRGGYRANPLEVMAYELQDRFERGAAPLEVSTIVRTRLDRVVPELFRVAGSTPFAEP